MSLIIVAHDLPEAWLAKLVVAHVVAGVRGERLPHCANPEVYRWRP